MSGNSSSRSTSFYSALDSTVEIAITDFLTPISSHEQALANAVGGWLRALLNGLQEEGFLDTCTCNNGDACLNIKLTVPAVVGRIATRSRVPGEWVLLQNVQISVQHSTSTTKVLLKLKGLQVIPLEGATRLWKSLSASSKTHGGAEITLDNARKVAWDYWQSHSSDYLNTKTWRVIQSMCGLGYGKVVPTYARASMVLGCALGIHQDVTEMEFQLFSESSQVDVTARQEPVAAAKDPNDPEYNVDEEIKAKIGNDLWKETSSSSVKRQFAQRCAPSALNYAALFCASPPDRGAAWSSVEKLFTVARNYGGATTLDIIRGRASQWQLQDETYQMTGDDGRVVWEALRVNETLENGDVIKH